MNRADRGERALIAWQILQAAHGAELCIKNGALGRGVSDAMAGRAYGERRSHHDCKADYALGWHVARFALHLAGVRYVNTLGDGKRRLYWRFRDSADGRSYGASYRFPPQVSLESST